jgi:hypothetical protein
LTTHEREILEPVALTLPDGTLNPSAIGWTREPLHACALPRGWGRRKRWSYWCVMSERGALQITLADLDYLGLAVASWLDLAKGELIEVRRVLPFGALIELSDVIESERVRLPGLSIDIDERAAGTELRVRSGAIEADAFVERPRQTMGVVVPWSDRHFQYTAKRVAKASADIRGIGEFEGFGALDFGRGIWPAKTIWNWGVGYANNLAFTIGGQWTRGTGATENALMRDGVITKLGDELEWCVGPYAPWRIRSPQADLRFSPLRTRNFRVELGVAHSRLRLGFGRWDGRIDGEDISGALGWAEEHHARW